jgi:hypothetical protein
MENHLRTELVLAAIDMALAQRHPQKVVNRRAILTRIGG